MIKDLYTRYTNIRFRNRALFWGTLIAFVTLFGTDPDLGWIHVPFGADVLAKLSGIPAAVFGVFVLYMGTKTLHDFFNSYELYNKAKETPVGAGLALIAKAIGSIAVAAITLGFLGLFAR